MEGLGGLGINVSTLLAQIINFIILFGLLYLVAYKPIMRMLDERSARVKESMEQTERIKEQAANAEEESRKQIEAAGMEGQELIAKATRNGEEIRQQAQQEASQQAESLLNRARTEIQRERDEAIGELRQEVADLTILAAEKVINRSLDKETHRRLIEETIEGSSNLRNN